MVNIRAWGLGFFVAFFFFLRISGNEVSMEVKKKIISKAEFNSSIHIYYFTKTTESLLDALRKQGVLFLLLFFIVLQAVF